MPLKEKLNEFLIKIFTSKLQNNEFYRCLNVRPEHCMEPSLFNNETCSCECDTSLYNRDQIRCETFDDRTWDPVTCTCRKTYEGVLLAGPKQENEARAAAEAAGEALPERDGRHHHHKVSKINFFFF